MAIKQLIGITWDKNKHPFFVLNSSRDKEFQTVPAHGKITLKKLDQKFCIGYYDLDELKEYPCPENRNLTNTKFINCLNCQKRTGFDQCLRCNGYTCITTNKKVKKFCQRPHFVYLVYFGQDIYKVGTAVEHRAIIRLLEQGASYSCFWAKADGRIARQIEYNIGKRGVKTKLNGKQKTRLFIHSESSNTIFSKLQEKLDELINSLPEEFSKFLIEPIFNNFYPANLLNVLYQVSAPKDISGEIVAIVGSIALIKKDYSYIAINLKPFFGWLVDINIEN